MTQPFDSHEDATGATPAEESIIAAALHAWNLKPVAEPDVVGDSVVNRNFEVSTSSGDVYVRLHHVDRDLVGIEREHRIIDWCAERGIPTNRPLAANDGRTVRDVDGTFVAVFPWIGHAQPPQLPLGDDTAALIGALHGQLHTTLAGYSDADLAPAPPGISWDTDRSVQELSRVDDVIRYYPAPGPERLRAQELLRYQLDLLEEAHPRPFADFANLPVQPCHGDLHRRNVLVTVDGRVEAVVDWEMFGTLPPLFEVLRSLTYSSLLESPARIAYIEAYALNAPYDPAIVDASVEMWWQHHLHSAWTYTAVFIRGERRAARFFEANHDTLRLLANPVLRSELAQDFHAFAR